MSERHTSTDYLLQYIYLAVNIFLIFRPLPPPRAKCLMRTVPAGMKAHKKEIQIKNVFVFSDICIAYIWLCISTVHYTIKGHYVILLRNTLLLLRRGLSPSPLSLPLTSNADAEASKTLWT